MRTSPAPRLLRPAAALLLTGVLVAGCGTAAPEGATGGTASTSASTAGPLGPEDAAALQALVDAGAVGAVMHVRDGDEVTQGAAGVADLSTGSAATPEAPLRIASITKTAVAAAVVQLAERGDVSLDDRVEQHLPGVLPVDRAVTVRQLLSHTSGMPSSGLLEAADVAAVQRAASQPRTDAELVAAALAEPWGAEPGTAFAYTNEGYVVLGMLLEEVTGQPVQQVLAERVLAPAGMDDTSWPADTSMPEGSLRGYVTAPGTPPVDVTEQQPSLWSSGAALVSTAADVDALFAGLSDGTLVSAASWEQVRAVGVEGYGLGVLAGGDACGAEPVELVYGQRGNGYGYRSIALGSPDGDRRVVLAWTGAGLDPADDALLPAWNGALVTALAGTCP